MSSTPRILMPPVVRPSRVRKIERVIVTIREEKRKHSEPARPHGHPTKSHAHK